MFNTGCSNVNKVNVNFSSFDFLGDQEYFETELDDLNFIKEVYTCSVYIVDREKLKLSESENDAYTIIEGKYIAISPDKRGLFDFTKYLGDNRKFLYAVVQPKTSDAGLIRFTSFRVKISDGPLMGAIVTIKPFDFIPGEINDTITIRSLTDPVQSFYPLPDTANALKQKNLNVEIISVTW